ncbi:class I SAM-dependent DNA methyltransferase [Culicoidibacter larvae]|uniref:Class I SAM-dependent methyltransferase n=1 Tax=Culicoidibacter larvae TaxID=2579976 RepID=A0A5R8Q979_9FIRM|nr:class I SAM-dependent methyltransferase [Culicoidibacter larvae]TLG72474.1 class I SAM-dependent methyltransferase [Culicoidibacter larvae]
MYEQFAGVYDQLMLEAPYQEWVEYIKQFLPKQAVRIADLGCGSGYVAVELAKLGHHVTGIDISSDMLALARERARQASVDVEWVCADMSTVDLGGEQFDIIISTCDSINYLLSSEAVQQCFKHVFSAIKFGGKFVFDVHSETKRDQFADFSYADNDENCSVIWESYMSETDKTYIFHDMSFFVLEADGCYRRFDEIHEQWLADAETYKILLQNSGFTSCTCSSDFSNEWREDGERSFFIADK